jgi:hypothetical protein
MKSILPWIIALHNTFTWKNNKHICLSSFPPLICHISVPAPNSEVQQQNIQRGAQRRHVYTQPVWAIQLQITLITCAVLTRPKPSNPRMFSRCWLPFCPPFLCLPARPLALSAAVHKYRIDSIETPSVSPCTSFCVPPSTPFGSRPHDS